MVVYNNVLKALIAANIVDRDTLQEILSTTNDRLDSIANYWAKVHFDDEGNVLIGINADNIGLARDATVAGIKALMDNLSFDSNKNLLMGINVDYVGLARDASVQKLFPTHIGDYTVSLSNTGTAAVYKPVLANPVTIEEDGVYGIVVMLDTATEIKLDVTIGTVTHSGLLNDGNALTANAWYEFDICLHANDQINFEVNVPAGGSVSGIIRIFKK